MSRGTSSAQEILYGEHVSTRTAEPLIELTALQEVGLKAVASLMLTYPDAPGFQSVVIREAGYPYRPDRSTVLGINNAGAIISGLVPKCLAEKTPQVQMAVDAPGGGWTSDEERGWLLTPQGLTRAEMLGVLPFEPRRP